MFTPEKGSPQFQEDGDVCAIISKPIHFPNPIFQKNIKPKDLDGERDDWMYMFGQYGMDEIPLEKFIYLINKGTGSSFEFDDEENKIIKDFILNNEPYSKSKILLAGKNFGCGSSREHAPWALLDFGITCVISSSYADIFYSNCFKNGILPIILPEERIKELSEYSKRKEEISIDLKEEKIIFGNSEIKFDIDPFKKKCLLEGLDDIALSLAKKEKITTFEENLKNSKPWIFNDKN